MKRDKETKGRILNTKFSLMSKREIRYLSRPNIWNITTDILEWGLILAILWGISSLIAWDYNPANWWGFGRFIVICVVLIIFAISISSISKRNKNRKAYRFWKKWKEEKDKMIEINN